MEGEVKQKRIKISTPPPPPPPHSVVFTHPKNADATRGEVGENFPI